MRLFTAGVASAFLCGSTALIAQSVPPADQAGQRTQAPSDAPTIEQQASLETWSADQRSQYPSWPADQKAYFWALTPAQQQAWWRLTPEQRNQIYGMTPEQRTQTWTSIKAQLSGTSQPGASGAGTATPGSLADPASQPSTGVKKSGKTTGRSTGN